MRPRSHLFLLRHLSAPFRTSFLLALIWTLLAGSDVAAAAETADRIASLRDLAARAALSESLTVRSSEEGEMLRAEILGTIDRSFATVAAAVTDPLQWCEFVPLHLNVKACTYSPPGSRPVLTFYVGRKFYQPPSEATPLRYSFRATEGDDYFLVVLAAPEGPLATRDYRLELEGIPVKGFTFLRFRLSYRRSLASRMAISSYLATLGRDKVGFSVVGREEEGPVLVGGILGIIERNAMRYYLALQAYLDTLELPARNRFEARLERWFTLTERFPQLHELEREEYLQGKRREMREQETLQR